MGYVSDITRTFILSEERVLREVYSTVREAQQLAIDVIEPGVRAEDVYSRVKEFISKAGYELPHGLGHGIGLEVHEKPSLSEGSKDILREGMVLTVEPGIYLEGMFGVRIEDDVLVTRDGVKVLSGG